MAAEGAASLEYIPIYSLLQPPSEWDCVWEEEIPGSLFQDLSPAEKRILGSARQYNILWLRGRNDVERVCIGGLAS